MIYEYSFANHVRIEAPFSPKTTFDIERKIHQENIRRRRVTPQGNDWASYLEDITPPYMHDIYTATLWCFNNREKTGRISIDSNTLIFPPMVTSQDGNTLQYLDENRGEFPLGPRRDKNWQRFYLLGINAQGEVVLEKVYRWFGFFK